MLVKEQSLAKSVIKITKAIYTIIQANRPEEIAAEPVLSVWNITTPPSSSETAKTSLGLTAAVTENISFNTRQSAEHN